MDAVVKTCARRSCCGSQVDALWAMLSSAPARVTTTDQEAQVTRLVTVPVAPCPASCFHSLLRSSGACFGSSAFSCTYHMTLVHFPLHHVSQKCPGLRLSMARACDRKMAEQQFPCWRALRPSMSGEKAAPSPMSSALIYRFTGPFDRY